MSKTILKFEIGEKIICINNRPHESLTYRKVYEVEQFSCDSGSVVIRNDAGSLRNYFLERFSRKILLNWLLHADI